MSGTRRNLRRKRPMPTDLLLLRRRYTVSSGKSKCNHVKCNSCNPLFFLFAQQTCPDSSVFNPTTSQCSASCTGGVPLLLLRKSVSVSKIASLKSHLLLFIPMSPHSLLPGSAPTTPTTTPSTTAAATTTTSTTTTAAPGGPFECPESTGTFANPVDCKSYYVCSNGNPSLFVSRNRLSVK